MNSCVIFYLFSSISGSRFKELAAEIKEGFPNEDVNIYYVPSKNGKNNTKSSALGLLQCYYFNHHRSLNRLHVIKKRKSKKGKNTKKFLN